MRILMIVKYPPIQGGVSVQNYWLAQALSELGHDVVVLTNANEVEKDYRIEIDSNDKDLLNGYRKKNAVRVVSTEADKNEFFIPFTKPFSSKLLSLGLEIVEEFKPDSIYAHYVEPYGVVAMNLSALTSVPYVIKHAGSDLGKLGLLPQMKTLHELVYRKSLFVATQEKHRQYFEGIGIAPEKIATLGFRHWPADVFFHSPSPEVRNGKIHLLIYGKTGASKGTEQLINALDTFKDSKSFTVTAYWGGRHYAGYKEVVSEKLLTERGLLTLRPYVSHWKIAQAIQSSHAVLYLENDFKISIHGPGIPFEVLGSGRLLITTQEIASKYPQTVTEENSIIIRDKPLTPRAIRHAMQEALRRCQEGCAPKDVVCLDEMYFRGIRNVEKFFESIEERL